MIKEEILQEAKSMAQEANRKEKIFTRKCRNWIQSYKNFTICRNRINKYGI